MATGLYGTKSSGNSGIMGNHSPHSVVEQSIITANYGVPVDLPKYRSKDESSRHIGHFRNDHELTIMPNEFFFIDKFDSFGSSTASFSANGFTGFNGLAIPDGVLTDDDFAQRFIFAGVTSGSVYVDGKTGVTSKSGVAVKRAGSGTLAENYGSSTFHPGDKIKLVLPSIDAGKRALQLNNRRVNRGHQGTGPGLSKIVPIPTVAFPTDIVNTFRTQALGLLQNSRKFDIESNQFNIGLRNRGVVGSKFSSKEQQTLYLKQFISAIAYSSITQAVQSGYVSINPTTSRASYVPTQFQMFVNNRANVISSKPYESYFDPATGVRSKATPQQQTEYKANMDNFSRLLSTSLGLTRDTSVSWLREDYDFTKFIRVRVLGSSSGHETYTKGQQHLISNDFSNTTGTNQGVFGTTYGTGSIKDKTIKRIMGTADQYYRSCGSTYDSEMKSIFADASNVSGPGQVLHYVLT